MSIDPIVQYYSNTYDEITRHSDPFGVIQEARTKELIARFLSAEFKSILDVGGAGGTYAFYLADRGYNVSLLDIVPRHIEYVRKINAQREAKLTDIILCDVMTYETDNKYDIILLHGPLYHLTNRADRVSVLSKMQAMLSPNGLLLGFGINRYAGYFYGVRSGRILNSHYRAMVTSEVKTGVREKEPGWFFHKPQEIVQEFDDSGFEVLALKSITTQLWMLPDIDVQLRKTDGLQQLLSIAEDLEDEVEIGQDFLCVGKIKH